MDARGEEKKKELALAFSPSPWPSKGSPSSSAGESLRSGALRRSLAWARGRRRRTRWRRRQRLARRSDSVRRLRRRRPHRASGPRLRPRLVAVTRLIVAERSIEWRWRSRAETERSSACRAPPLLLWFFVCSSRKEKKIKQKWRPRLRPSALASSFFNSDHRLPPSASSSSLSLSLSV